MSKLLEAEDILTEVRDFIECIGMAAAASHLAREFGAPDCSRGKCGQPENRRGGRVAERISRVQGLRWACSSCARHQANAPGR
jgi:hypothetical protein